MKKVLIAADEVDKWSQLCEGLPKLWEWQNRPFIPKETV